MKYHKVALGGTFDCFHKGHEALITRAFEIGEQVVVGITSDDFARIGHISLIRRISHIRNRKRSVAAFVKKHGWMNRCQIIKISDHEGPAVDDTSFDAIVVSPETETFAKTINEKRATKGHSPLIITVVPWVLADDGQPIHATRIRSGEIGPHGEVFTLPPEWGVRLIPDEVRKLLQKPFGKFYEGNRISYIVYRGENKKKVPDIPHTNPDILLISVGDRVTQSLLQAGTTPQIAIVDYHIQRKKKFTHFTQHGFGRDVAVAEVKNPAGTVSYEAFAIVQKTIATHKSYTSHKTYKTHVIVVDGEEDLMVLPAILAAPLGVVVLYGQPGYQSVPGKPPINDQPAGVVAVEVTVEKKREVMEILSQFQMTNYK